MTTRVFGALTILACGCGLVSGLDSLNVNDGGVTDANALDVSQSDEATGDATEETSPIDGATPDVDANAQLPSFALSTLNSCTSTGAPIALATGAFTVAFWLKATGVFVTDEAIVWNGGRSSSEQGWSVDLDIGGVEFCVAGATASTAKCTPPYPIEANHLVHLVATTTTNNQTGRTLNLYARDATNNDASHVLVGQVIGAASTWTTNVPFTVGGAMENTCTGTLTNGVIDGLRIATFALTIADMDTSLLTNVCNTLGVLDDFEFDEGTGATSASCAPGATTLTLGTNASLVTSPFP